MLKISSFFDSLFLTVLKTCSISETICFSHFFCSGPLKCTWLRIRMWRVEVVQPHRPQRPHVSLQKKCMFTVQICFWNYSTTCRYTSIPFICTSELSIWTSECFVCPPGVRMNITAWVFPHVLCVSLGPSLRDARFNGLYCATFSIWNR